MTDHRAELILDEIYSRLSLLATTRDHIVRDRPYPVESDVVSALSLYQGAEQVNEDSESWTYVDMDMSFYVDIHTRWSSDYPITQRLNHIRKEIVIALSPNESPPLGLAFCIDLEERGTEEPFREEGEYPIARQRMTWLIKYRRSRGDPSQ